MRFQGFSFAKALALCLPLLLAGCGGKKAPKDPCTSVQKNLKGSEMGAVERKAEKWLNRKKAKLTKELEGKVKFGKVTKNCYKPEQPKEEKMSSDPNAPDKKKKKKKKKEKRPVNAICEMTLNYCEKQ